MPKEYSLNGLAGLVVTRRCRLTGFMVSIYHNEQAGMDCNCGTGIRDDKHNEHHHSFSTLCEEHGQVCSHKTLALARDHMVVPAWCEPCQKILIEKGII